MSALYWPSIINYQLLLPQCLILTQYTVSSSRNVQLSQLDLIILTIPRHPDNARNVWSSSACRETWMQTLKESSVRFRFSTDCFPLAGGCWAFAEKVEDADLRHCIPVHSAAAQCIVKYHSASFSIPAAQCKTVMQVLPVHPSTKQFTPGWQQMDHSAQCICSATYQASLQCEKGRGALCVS